MALFSQNEDFEDGKLVKALQLTGVFKSVLESIKSKGAQSTGLDEVVNKLKDSQLFKIDKQLLQFVKEESEQFFY